MRRTVLGSIAAVAAATAVAAAGAGSQPGGAGASLSLALEDASAAQRTALATPARLHAAFVGEQAIRLRWSARRRGELRWIVVRNGKRHASISATARTYVDRRVRPGRTYHYRVIACRRDRCGRAARLRVRALQPFGGPGTVGTEISGCPIFPVSSPWNRDISQDPVHPDSAAFIESIGFDGRLHPDFGSGRYGDFGIPFEIVGFDQPMAPVEFTAFRSESDPGPYPVPPGARIEGGSDRHVIVLQGGHCRLYEMYKAEPWRDGWRAESGATFNLRSNDLRPRGWTSADAAGLPILPGLARPDEIAAGRITHALRFTAARTQRAYISPARHFASSSRDRALPPMGLRVRLRADYDLSGFRGQSRVILEALKTYGMFVADNGSDWFLSGAADPGWDDEDLEQLKRVPGRAFEAVYTGPITRG